MPNKDPKYCPHESVNDQHPEGLECRDCGTIGEFVSKADILNSLKHDEPLNRLWTYVTILQPKLLYTDLFVFDGTNYHKTAGALLSEMQHIMRKE